MMRGEVQSLWRHPVKSLGGEEVPGATITPGGLLGDRALALIDPADGTLISAKNPRKWPTLFQCRAAYLGEPQPGSPLPAVQITLADGTTLGSDEPDVASRLTRALGHPVRLASQPPESPAIQMYWPDDQGDVSPKMTRESLPPGAFFDLAPIHLVTTATLRALSRLHPQGAFDVRRFRPNLVVSVEGDEPFPERAWISKTLVIGEVKLQVQHPCPRCIMTTLAQPGLSRDPAILKTIAQHNEGNVGVYAVVVQAGTIRRGDQIQIA